ncbi:MAG TPA: DUF835 domain-containing protein, partial [Methanophagales archaeon]|nr:DUF835 domain-containing protein [Methanophagales archaeon]
GIDASHEIKAKLDIPIIFSTAYSDVELIDRAKSIEPYAYIVKPFQESQLRASIEMAMHKNQIEKELKESEEFSSSLLNNAPNPIIVINPDSAVRYVNPALEKLIGFSSAELIGKKAPYPWWTEETLEKTSRDLEEAMRKGATGVEERFQRKNGERFWVELTFTPVKNNGVLKYYLANWVDVTERKRAEEMLQRAHDELECRVKERTAELVKANEQLKQEIRERKHAEVRVKDLELLVLHRLFKQGKGYLLVEEKPDTGFKLFSKLIKYGFKGLLISRAHSSHIRSEYDITDAQIIWLTHIKGESNIVPTEIPRLNLAVLDFAEMGVEGVIMLEGLEYLIAQNGFEVALRFVQAMVDIVTISKCSLIMPFDAQILSEIEFHQLEREVNVINAKEAKELI